MIGTDIVTTMFAPRGPVYLFMPIGVQLGRSRVIMSMFAGRWPSEN